MATVDINPGPITDDQRADLRGIIKAQMELATEVQVAHERGDGDEAIKALIGQGEALDVKRAEIVGDEVHEVTAEIAMVEHKFGKWLIAKWTCPVCLVTFQFHSGSHVQAIVQNAIEVLEGLHGSGIQEPCPRCGANHDVRQKRILTGAPNEGLNRKARRIEAAKRRNGKGQ